ncbi:hypothetical protein ABZ897_20225 [Nonomuraea sp. NPDC046802]|uniref:hypothetical protein n=1 Tax=Nonomuraea sp. NPDC046802 TaxID=3154919 RepID=UPI0033DAE667
MRIWAPEGELMEIGEAYAAERFVSWLKKYGEKELERTLREFIHSPWEHGGLGAGLLADHADLEALRDAVLERWEPIRAGG